jgi:hypothetical protein
VVDRPILIVGAGIAGLAAASELSRHGRDVELLEKSHGVGGRCATRRVDGQPVDHGLAFFHATDPALLSRLDEVEGADPIPGWPLRIVGAGTPCQPAAFGPGARRLAYGVGVNAFPKWLARGLPIRRETRVRSLAIGAPGRLGVHLASGEDLDATTVVLAVPAEQQAALLEGLAAQVPGARTVLELVRLLGTVPVLTVVAGYPMDTPAPDWDIAYPEGSRCLLAAIHDSTKRSSPLWRVLVLQARPDWSCARLDADQDDWAADLVAEAARLYGSWAGTPAWRQSHTWRHARSESGPGWSGPLLLEFPGGARLGLAGENWYPEGGVQGAYRSGAALAARILAAEVT